MSNFIDTEAVRRAAGSISGSIEVLQHISRTLDSAADTAKHAGGHIEDTARVLSQLFDPACGGAVHRLIELLEAMSTAPVDVPETDSIYIHLATLPYVNADSDTITITIDSKIAAMYGGMKLYLKKSA